LTNYEKKYYKPLLLNGIHWIEHKKYKANDVKEYETLVVELLHCYKIVTNNNHYYSKEAKNIKFLGNIKNSNEVENQQIQMHKILSLFQYVLYNNN